MKTKKKTTKPVCSKCGQHDSLFIVLASGERLPSYKISMVDRSITCNKCGVKK